MDALVYIVHGFNGSGEQLGDVARLAETCFPAAKVITPTFAHTKPLNNSRAADIAAQIANQIAAEHQQFPDARIRLIGHSIGCALLLHTIGKANCRTQNWVSKVELILMLATMERGWNIEHVRSSRLKLLWRASNLLGKLTPKRFKPTIFDFHHCAPFIRETHQNWQKYCQKTSEESAKIIYLTGENDPLVPAVSTPDLPIIEIPQTGHKSIIQLEPKTTHGELGPQACQLRKQIIASALIQRLAISEHRQ